MEINKKLEWL